jgi:hypothetical protein
MVLVATAGCVAGPDASRHALNEQAGPTQAFILPPAGGPAIITVIERPYTNAIEQEIVLASESSVSGQNMLRAQFFGPVGRPGTGRLADRVPRTGELSREMRQLFPGVRMQVSTLYVQNSYGPFGYATGRHASGDACLYGWQRLTGSRSAGPFAGYGTIQIRLRLCRRGATEQSLLAVMYGYTIAASLGGRTWGPYGSVPAPDPRIGRTGQPVYATGGNWTDAAQEPFPEPPRAARRTVARAAGRVEPPPAVIAAPPPGAPIVPAPPGIATQTGPLVPPPPARNDAAPR